VTLVILKPQPQVKVVRSLIEVVSFQMQRFYADLFAQ
jgi:hypothetical protein